ncbi:hypothetical protein [Nocardia sp. NRRL S-836]|uniref:hypothetical protein n=1 Tax=Nocardia sp. NRRL S-836 TaxID=1519492 RepID=UPI0006AED108|nr:hypothetical protein [Nocardia sp. NRRL S-836]KOV84710.1 hypothetical protein ADL03_15680 [Nocardia sp. NRRL S-836]
MGKAKKLAKPEPESAPVMTWPLAVVVIVTVVSGFGFAFALIAVAALPPWLATVITTTIVSALIPRRGDGGVWRRIANAIHALGGGDGSGGPGSAR